VCIEPLELAFNPLLLSFLFFFAPFFFSLAAFLFTALELFLALLSFLLPSLLFIFPLLFLLLTFNDTFLDTSHPFDVSDFDLLAFESQHLLVELFTKLYFALANLINLPS
jgi:hypothetical protein